MVFFLVGKSEMNEWLAAESCDFTEFKIFYVMGTVFTIMHNYYNTVLQIIIVHVTVSNET
jgi:hypothetical protein